MPLSAAVGTYALPAPAAPIKPAFRYNDASADAANHNSAQLDNLAAAVQQRTGPRLSTTITADPGFVFLASTFEVPHLVSIDAPGTRWCAARDFSSKGYGPLNRRFMFTLGSPSANEKVAFNCRINGFIDCNHIDNLGGVWTNMAQEHSGLHNLTIMHWTDSAIVLEAFNRCTPQNWMLTDIFVNASRFTANRNFIEVTGDSNQGVINKASLVTGKEGQQQACGILVRAARVSLSGIHAENLRRGVQFSAGASGRITDSDGLGGEVGKGMVDVLVWISANAGPSVIVENCRRFGAEHLLFDEQLGAYFNEDLARYSRGSTVEIATRAQTLTTASPSTGVIDIIAARDQTADLLRVLDSEGRVLSAIDALGRFTMRNAAQDSPSRSSWAAPVGVADRSAFDTARVSTGTLARHLKALIDDLRASGIIL